MPMPLESTSIPKINFDDINGQLIIVISENTCNFSQKLRSSLIQVWHLINQIKLQDQVFQEIITRIPQDAKTIVMYQMGFKSFLQECFPITKPQLYRN